MTRDEIRKEVLDIIAEVAPDEDLTTLDPDKRLREQIELDSMDFLDIVMGLRKRHKVDVPESEYMELATLSGCVRYLEPKMKHLPSPAKK
ncbi:MAG: acyl carrier protein [Planctomycetota bacterium]